MSAMHNHTQLQRIRQTIAEFSNKDVSELEISVNGRDTPAAYIENFQWNGAKYK